MKLLGRNKEADDNDGDTAAAVVDQSDSATSAGTAPKGRPTPKRNESARRRGPIAPAPMTAAEARARRKSIGGPKLSRAERKIERNERRGSMNDRRERMMAGDEAYLLPRDQGPVKRFVRDYVDSRRNVLGLFMPSALMLIFVMFAVPQVQVFISPAMLILMAVMAIDGIWLAHRVSTAVDAKFPNNTEGRWKLGIYAAGRASQLRRMRAPRPQVARGAKVV